MATYNRADYIAETLDSILPHLGDAVELVILDGGSTDATPTIVQSYVDRCPHIRYVREAAKSGIDADFDKAVGSAWGEYCWLFSDDDFFAPGAVARVLEALSDPEIDLIVVDSEVRDLSMKVTLDARRLAFSGERDYGPGDRDAFMADAAWGLGFIGGTIIRRSLWLQRHREPYYGSFFVHVGVIFQDPAIPRAKVIAEPLVRIRLGNASWSARGFEIFMFKWPDLIWGFDGYSDQAKAAVTPRHPWRLPLRVFLYRAHGGYRLETYRRFFRDKRVGASRPVLLAAALMPGKLAHFLAVAMLIARRQGRSSGVYQLVNCSPNTNRFSRGIVRAFARPAWLAGGSGA